MVWSVVHCTSSKTLNFSLFLVFKEGLPQPYIVHGQPRALSLSAIPLKRAGRLYLACSEHCLPSTSTHTAVITSLTILLNCHFDITISRESGSPVYSSICKSLITLPAIKSLAKTRALNRHSWNNYSQSAFHIKNSSPIV